MSDNKPGGLAARKVRMLAYACLLLGVAVNLYARASESNSTLLYGAALGLTLVGAGLLIARMVALDRFRRRG